MGAHRYWRLIFSEADGGVVIAGSKLELRSSGVNLATDTTKITASSTFGGFDVRGLINSSFGQWASGNLGLPTSEWVAYDFGSAVDIDEWKWTNRTDGSKEQGPKAMALQWSDDAATWVTEAYGFWEAWDFVGETQTFTIPAAYTVGSTWGVWGVTGEAGGANSVYTFAEVENRATVGGARQNTGGNTAASSTFSGLSSNSAYDGDASTFWASADQNYPQFVLYGWASPVATAQIALTARNDSSFDQSPTAGDVIYSSDGACFGIAWHYIADTWTQGETQLFDDPNGDMSSGEVDSSGMSSGEVDSSGGAVSSGFDSSGGDFSSGEVDSGGPGAKVSGAVTLAAIETPRDAIAAEAAVLAAIEPTPPPERVGQGLALVAGEIVPAGPGSSACVLVLVEAQPCATSRCQLWTITRKDGRVFRFTSLDEDVTYGGDVYSKCNSLMASAAESASAVGSVGSVDLSGIIDDDAISEADIYGGLFDDAEVEVWLVAWDDEPFVPVRLAAGNMGEVSQGEQGFKSEVVGPGARLGQQSVVQVVSPNCSWKFGDPATCKVDREALAISGTVTRGYDRGLFTADLSDGSNGPQWANGIIRWTGGKNAGREDEIKTVDFANATIQLWNLAAFVPDYGDTFDALPGCDLLKTGGCRVYDNIINFGGFDIPGDDSLMQTPDAQY